MSVLIDAALHNIVIVLSKATNSDSATILQKFLYSDLNNKPFMYILRLLRNWLRWWFRFVICFFIWVHSLIGQVESWGRLLVLCRGRKLLRLHYLFWLLILSKDLFVISSPVALYKLSSIKTCHGAEILFFSFTMYRQNVNLKNLQLPSEPVVVEYLQLLVKVCT